MIPTGENIIETKNCPLSGQAFHITDKDIQYYDQIAPVFAGKKYSIPTPTLCPAERERRRLLWRNELGLYHRTCDLTGEKIVSLYSPDKPYKVYSQKGWWSDDYDPFVTGRSFDFDRPFFPQFDELLHDTPFVSSVVFQCENCDFNNYCGDSKDCYMSVRVGSSRDIYYSYYAVKSDTCVDSTFITDCRECYHALDCESCHATFACNNCKNCQQIRYCKDCVGCNNCFLCVGLRNQEYCIQNKKYSPEEYRSRIAQWSDVDARGALQKMLASIPHREHENMNCSNSVGNHLKNCEDVFYAFDSQDIKQGKYLMAGENGEYQYDTSYGHHGSFTHDMISIYYGSNVFFMFGAYHSSFAWYSFQVYNSQNVFGCAGLKKGKNVILNTSYSEHEYQQLASKIVAHMISTGEWGEYFPASISPFGYNETVAQTIYPFTQAQAKSRSYKWHDDATAPYQGEKYQPLPISSYDEAIVGSEEAKKNINACLAGTIVCDVTGKPFRIVRKELAFYIQNHLSLPTTSPIARMQSRAQDRNPPFLWDRTCDKCSKSIQTSYSPDRPEKIYCEECYRKEIY